MQPYVTTTGPAKTISEEARDRIVTASLKVFSVNVGWHAVTLTYLCYTATETSVTVILFFNLYNILSHNWFVQKPRNSF